MVVSFLLSAVVFSIVREPLFQYGQNLGFERIILGFADGLSFSQVVKLCYQIQAALKFLFVRRRGGWSLDRLHCRHISLDYGRVILFQILPQHGIDI